MKYVCIINAWVNGRPNVIYSLFISSFFFFFFFSFLMCSQLLFLYCALVLWIEIIFYYLSADGWFTLQGTIAWLYHLPHCALSWLFVSFHSRIQLHVLSTYIKPSCYQFPLWIKRRLRTPQWLTIHVIS